ncbi:MAG: glycosyltransferase family 2 protein [archaeon]
MSKLNKPLVSIITPSYNQGNFIEENIISIKNQCYDNVEHIIIDAKSQDNTKTILKKYENSYNLKWISEKDKGQAHAINKGIKMANGKIIGWLNSDDVYIHENVFDNIVKTFLNNKIDIVYGNALKIDENNNLKRIDIPPKYDFNLLKKWCYIVQPTVFFKSKVLKNNLLNIDLDYSIDYELWLRIGQKYYWYYLDDFIAGDRNHKNRKIVKNISESKKETRTLQANYKNHNTLYNIYEKYLKLYLRLKGLYKYTSISNNNIINIKKKISFKFLINQLFGNNSNFL